MRVLKLGDRGKEVLDVQARLCGLGYNVGTDGVDGLFGPDTLAAALCFQQERGLLADGIVAENTWCEIVEAGYEAGERLLYLRIPPFRGDDVLDLQRSLNRLGFNSGPEDGIFGPATERAVLDFQKNAGMVMDGMVDDAVLRAMVKVTKNGEPHAVMAKIPDRNGGYTSGQGLADITVAIDPGHGGPDQGGVSPTGVREKDLNLKAALALAEALKTAGSKVMLTRDDDSAVPLYNRPETANNANADLFISIHHNGNSNTAVQGSAAYYFYRQGYYSEAGRMLAQHLVKELSSQLEVPAIPVLGRNYAVLRETKMTAVLVEPVFITAAKQSGTSGLEQIWQRESEAIFHGLEEYFAK